MEPLLDLEMRISGINIETGKRERDIPLVDVRAFRNAKFSVIIPHSGVIIPSDADFIDAHREVIREAIFRDGDPYLHEINFSAHRGQVFKTNVHRDAGDTNRALDSPEFLRSESFHGTKLHAKKPTRQQITRLKEYHRQYWEIIQSHLPEKQHIIFHVHSMDSRGGGNAVGGEAPRPDVCITYGEEWQFASPEVAQLSMKYFTRYFKKVFPKCKVKANDPFDGQGDVYALMRQFSRPKKGWHGIQVELNKDLFMERGELDREGFKKMKQAVTYAMIETTNAYQRS